MIIFQGLEDKVVPPNQAEKMVEAVRAKKLPVAYLTFEGSARFSQSRKYQTRARSGAVLLREGVWL
jgi:dipeptidyl aminopeptidase/acylaminoacyl peptidase